MFRFFKYDDTGYTDLENSIFSNLNQTQFDRLNDKITIEEIDYRLSTVKELCDNCNNSETFINETMNARPTHRIIRTPGAKGTIPETNDHTDGSWLPTDLYNGEVLINITDNVAYIRSGNEIRSWQLNPIDLVSPVAFEYIEPESITVGNPPAEVMFYGSGLDQITGVNYDTLDWGVIVSDFEVLSQEEIILIIDASQANLEGSSGVTLEIPFITSFDEIITASLSLTANSIPQGDPVITSIEPYEDNTFVPGEQTVIIFGNNLNSREGLSINPENDMITQLSYEFDADNNILAQMDIPQEVLDTQQTFVLSYTGYLSEPFTVLLNSSVQKSQPKIETVTDIEGNPVIVGTTELIINGSGFGSSSSLTLFVNDGSEEQIPYGDITTADNVILVSGCDLGPPYADREIGIIVTGTASGNSDTYYFTLTNQIQ